MPNTKLQDIINDFKAEEFITFFRQKTQEQGNFRISKELLPHYNDTDFSDFLKLGQIEFAETEKLVCITAKVSRDLSERSGKKAQYEKAKRILKEMEVYSVGIFIFYDTSGNFRFSLIYPESVGSHRQWSNFRRFTYFVSKEFTNKTFSLRVGDGDFSGLDGIKDAFSVEKVTEEFYLQYRRLFDELAKSLSENHTFLNEAEKNNIKTKDFAKKLLGQIVFLYFVQKKGWLGVPSGKKWGEGDKNFMGNLFKGAASKNANFYNDYLEKLFYNTLNNPRRDSADPSFSKDFNSRIPFLNGGLFESEYDWENSSIHLDNKIFKDIFDIFDRYNFTIEEESPDDKEVAVDPEMLGKVFENLLPENLRKGKGTYYTPREIVHYMCRESLINYLVTNHSNITEENIRNYIFYSDSSENFQKQKAESFTFGQYKELDDLLKNINVVDPACGSGAFLVTMLNLIVKFRLFLQTTSDYKKIPRKSEYELKKETIQNCIYGVDIDPGAIEIAKLRLWLSLVVDYGLEEIEPLPNLDYLLMCGNSLLEEFEGVKFYDDEEKTPQATLLVDSDKQQKITNLKKKVKEYFNIHDDKEKREKRKEINDIKDWLIRNALEAKKQEIAFQRKSTESKADMLNQQNREKFLADWSNKFLAEAKIEELLKNLHNPKKEKPFFLWKLEFMDVFEDKGGFDVVIGNPPYGLINKKQNKHTSITMDEKEFEALKNHYPDATGGMINIFRFFIVQSVSLLKNKGCFSEIFPLSFTGDQSMKNLRKSIFDNNKIVLIEAFPERDDVNKRVFKSVKMSVCIMTLIKVRVEDTFYIRKNYDRFVDKNNEKVLLSVNDIKLFDPENLSIPLVNSQDCGLLRKLYKFFGRFGDFSRCFDGEVHLTKYKHCITDNHNDAALIKGAIVDRYQIRGKMSQGTIQFLNKALFLSDNSGEKAQHHRNPRIVMQRITGVNEKTRIKATIIDSGIFCANSIGYLVLRPDSYDKEYVLAVLNSKVSNYIFKLFSTNSNVNGYEIENLPFPLASSEENKNILIELVDKILTITKFDDYQKSPAKQANVREYEKQIDQLVYKLYGLTPEEIAIVEG